MTKRCFDVLMAGTGIVILAPSLLVLAIIVKLNDGGPVFYRQERVGRKGRHFRIWKFRSMHVGAERMGPSITAAGDYRVTRIGRFLRKYKLDELPQLFNILGGRMSFVGPRPEVPKYVALYTIEQRRVLELRPGITDVATLEFRDEEELLAGSGRPELFYEEYCIPRKIFLNLEYAGRATIVSDIGVIVRTLVAVVRPRLSLSEVDRGGR